MFGSQWLFQHILSYQNISLYQGPSSSSRVMHFVYILLVMNYEICQSVVFLCVQICPLSDSIHSYFKDHSLLQSCQIATVITSNDPQPPPFHLTLRIPLHLSARREPRLSEHATFIKAALSHVDCTCSECLALLEG